MNPSVWLVKLLGLPEEPDQAEKPGLILVQIDGLSYDLMSRAMKRGQMPYLRSLYEKEDYVLRPLYPGIPSNTPSVQGELFYGVKRAVPAFYFQDSGTGRLFKMYERESASAVEEKLKKEGRGLLEGGSSYGNIFSGGAKTSHYTAATFGWDSVKQLLQPARIPLTLLLNLHITARIVILIFIELYLAVLDFLRGVNRGYSFASELSFIPTRVIVSIFLREMITAHAKMDAVRGVPVIHLNLFGYDEQSHRRGPASWFASWSLRGIDSAIRRVAAEARLSMKRQYEIWVYSDHGQEDSVPYARKLGKSIEHAVGEIYGELIDSAFRQENLMKAEGGCLCCIPERAARVPLQQGREKTVEIGACLSITAMGPIGFIYPPRPLNKSELELFAAALAERAKLPVVIVRIGDEISVWTHTGKHSYEEGLLEALGPSHPYAREICRDVRELLGHPDAGALTFFGWHADLKKPVTFPDEHGAHGGIGPSETNGFTLLPADAPLENVMDRYLDPMDLRLAALRLLERLQEAGSGSLQASRLKQDIPAAGFETKPAETIPVPAAEIRSGDGPRIKNTRKVSS